MDSNFEELSNDQNIIHRLKEFSKATDDIEKMIELVNDPKFYDTLENSDKIKYNLMMSFALNSLFWMYLRAEGVDPSNHSIKTENNRLKQAMARAQEIRDKKTLMPRIKKDVAKRFVRNSLWDPNNTNEGQNVENVDRDDDWEIVHPDQPPSSKDNA